MSDRIETPLGGWVQLDELPDHLVERIGGPGLMLRIGMQDPKDIRYAEIVLSAAGVAALISAAGGTPAREMEHRELHHFEVEQENERLHRELATPPPGWYTFGTHAGTALELEFWGGDAGLPLWERPVDLDVIGRELLHVREVDGISYWRKGPQDKWHQLPFPSGRYAADYNPEEG